MDKKQRVVDILTESLETGRGGHSITWRVESRTCSCGAEFKARVANIDGEDRYATDQCPECQGEALALERLAEAQEKLAAVNTMQLERWILECGCPPILLTKTFPQFDKSRQPRAYKLMSQWDWAKGKSIVLLSDGYGVGKTHLCAALVNKMLQTEKPAMLVQGLYVQTRKCPVHFTTEPQLLDRIRATFNRTDENAETDEQIYRHLALYQVLIIDDVGKVKPQNSAFVQGVYFRIINTRCDGHKPIVLTTNLNLKELEAHIGGACGDRLNEMCGQNFIKMTGESYRGKRG